ncbi:MAG: two component, sigma54 specific, transcriptional regulator, Fis family [Candidatus Krumholzibacteriota bacterium]|nr:two component, sigma54 specific, transcriptional regulator, Fis family [Candidatus Krumholzibacteriota bacterium]
MPIVLIVDDVRALAEQYAYDLKRIAGYETLVASGGGEALETIAVEPVDCVILDLEMPGVDGFEVLRRLKKDRVPVPVIVYTGTGNYDRCVKAIKLGAYGFIDKAETMERVAREIENALERARLRNEVEALRRDLGRDTPLVGASEAMKELRERIARVAPIPSPVLIVGESGTGKELVARELHRLGGAENRPFVAINSAAIPENLVESELFGHERGAFTGANRTHKGAFELATGGTLFLDEVGELPLTAQAKLLRVLEDNRVTRVGGERAVSVNARVVAATNRDLESEAETRRFRADLYYRLNVHVLRVPALRERRSDIPDLVEHFLDATCARFGIRRKTITRQALELLSAREWRRNNVRELRNVVERMVIATDAPLIDAGDVPAEPRPAPSEGEARGEAPTAPGTFQELKSESERRIIAAALERNGWNVTRTAKELGLADHASLLKIMRRLRLSRP